MEWRQQADSHNVSISFEKTIKKVSYLKTFLQKE